ncbi:hypothetical protein FIBSPDRAFT_1054981 [Athelia psychrophila]|uniref:Uncharacterized protein n=1 Tax=Athelia psychrophila TaxID=1759441 RepID=A0A167UHM8_9AGAM|nr:hypothetical protein FIBSPDRAFT_1054981 [Fibularhizoctonia sp. CBS 109695]
MLLKIILPMLALASCAFGQTDVSNLAGPFRLVTTASTAVPVVPTSYLELYYNTINSDGSGGLTLFSVPSSVDENETFRLVSGSLGTFYRPDDVSGSDPWNATTPVANGYLTFNNQAVAHAGFDLINSTFLAIHGVLTNT